MREAARVARGGAAGVPEARGVPGMSPVMSAAISGTIQALKLLIQLISILLTFFLQKRTNPNKSKHQLRLGSHLFRRKNVFCLLKKVFENLWAQVIITGLKL